MLYTVRYTLPEIPKAWPFEEARKVGQRQIAYGEDNALFETGHGPLGLPNIGTCGKVACTNWIRRAFMELTGLRSKLLAFSDDMNVIRPGLSGNLEAA
jgi:lysyl-tRNA synthetase class 1